MSNQTAHIETGTDVLKPRNLDRARQELVLDFAQRLVEQHGPVAEYGSANAAFSPIETIVDPDAKGTFIAFSSLRLEHPLPPAEFGGTLRGKGVSQVFVKDFSRVWYQHGLTGLSTTRSETATALTKILARYPRPWTFLGSSSGGYAALYFGMALGADRIFAFSPQTYVDRQTFSRFAKIKPFEAGFKASDPENDLMTCLPTNMPQTQIFHGTTHYKDKRQAAHFADVSGVTVTPVETGTHNIAKYLKTEGRLDDLLF